VTAERDLLIAALVDPCNLVSWSAPDLDLALRLLRRARLLGRVAAELEAAGLLGALPLAARDALASALIATQARARVARWELDRIAHALQGLEGLRVVAMKGCAYLLANLPHANGRMFADVDLLVPEERLLEVETRLKEHGWQSSELSAYDERYYREWTHELPPLTHAEREVEVDLHHNVLMRTARLHPDPRLMLAAARPVPESGHGGLAVMAPIDMTLHAMAHLFYGGEMDDALREVADIDALLRHFGAGEPGYAAAPLRGGRTGLLAGFLAARSRTRPGAAGLLRLAVRAAPAGHTHPGAGPGCLAGRRAGAARRCRDGPAGAARAVSRASRPAAAAHRFCPDTALCSLALGQDAPRDADPASRPQVLYATLPHTGTLNGDRAMDKLFHYAYRVLFVLACLGAAIAVIEGVAELGGRSLVGGSYSAGRMLDFAAAAMIFAIGFRLSRPR